MSSSSLHFTNLIGDYALCSLLDIDGFCILLDCGWDARFDQATLQPLKHVIHRVNAVLISHCDIHNLGALPYAVAKLGLDCPIFCTAPTCNLGHLELYNMVNAQHKQLEFSLDDVDAAFSHVVQLKPRQTHTLKEGITITARNAGRTLGGSYWVITTPDDSRIVYSVDWNYKKTRVLDMYELGLESKHTPSLMITDCLNAQYQPEFKKKKQRDVAFWHSISTTLQQNGNVLMSVNPSNTLEILHLLHSKWEHAHVPFSLVFLSSSADSLLHSARSLTEFMSNAINKEMSKTNINPFVLKRLYTCFSLQQLEEVPQPRLVITNESLECGAAQELLLKMTQKAANLVVLTDRGAEWSVGHRLYQHRRDILSGIAQKQPYKMQLSRRRVVILEGEELEQFRIQEQAVLEQKQLDADDTGDEEDDSELEYYDEEDDMGESLRRRRAHIKLVPVHPMFPVPSVVSSTLAAPAVPPTDDGGYGQAIDVELFSKVSAKAAAMEEAEAADLERSKTGQGFKSARHGDTDHKRDDTTSMDTDDRGGDEHHMEEEEEEEEEEDEFDSDGRVRVPTKIVTEQVELPIQCQVCYFDFEGRSDANGIKATLKLVKPRHLILVRGSEQSKQSLKTACKGVIKNIYCPKTNELVEIMSDISSFKVSLHPSLLSSIQTHDVGEYKVAHVEGQVLVDFRQSNVPILVPRHSVEKAPHPVVHIGSVKLKTVRGLLLDHNFDAQFCNGVLVCHNGQVQIRAIRGADTIKISGALSEAYFRIRQLLAQSFIVT